MDAVLVGGLDFWNYDRSENTPILTEDRLREAIVERLRKKGRELSSDECFRRPPIGNEREPSKLAGISVLEFPRWFVCQNPACRGLLRDDALVLKSDRYWHTCDSKRKSECVPVRFVSACKRGHIDDFQWIAFTHRESPRCGGPSLRLHEGATGDFNEISITCECGARQWLSATYGVDFQCLGKRPWLGSHGEETCTERGRLLVRTASNSYFPQVVSALSIPAPGCELHERVLRQWGILKVATKELLPGFRQIPQVTSALQGFSDEEVLQAIAFLREEKPSARAGLRTAEFLQFTSAPPEAPGDLPPSEAEFFARSSNARDGLPRGIKRLVLASKLREVAAQVGFTRLEPVSPDLQCEYDLNVESAALGLTTDWLPATEMRGEGVFLELDESVVAAWEDRPVVKARGAALLAGYEAWSETVESPPPFPGVRFYLLHSLSHLLISAIALECGYAASAIR